ncbi:MAG TPA: TlpA disulfide reductase family protein [Candidatus Deferrimicrobium sp.]|nr:TlpA disulfide reductase family protein [Candidatus Deferrimicrobium sp.]
MRTVRILVALTFLLGGMAFAGPPRDVPRFLGATGDGRPADFTLRGLDGQPVSLSRFLGKKPVLLVFWATWCPECKAASPKINALHDGLSGEKVQILALDYRETPERVAAAVKSRGIRYPVLLDEHGDAARAFGVVGIPTYVLIGRNGTVVYRDHVLPADISRFL